MNWRNEWSATEVIMQPLYDIVPIARGTTRLDFFSAPVGVNGKTLEDTNMYLPNALPNPQRFMVESLRVRLILPSEKFRPLVVPFYASGQVELMIGSKTYLYGAPLHEFKSFRGFPVRPLLLESMQNFGVSLLWRDGCPLEVMPNGARSQDNVRVAVHFYGKLARPVENVYIEQEGHAVDNS